MTEDAPALAVKSADAGLDAAMDALREEFEAAIRESLERCAALVEEAREAPDDNISHAKEIFGLMHDLKGQGLTFGYPAVTRIGASLCDYIRFVTQPVTAGHLMVVSTHLEALDYVIAQGPGEPVEMVWDELVPKLDLLIYKAGSPR